MASCKICGNKEAVMHCVCAGCMDKLERQRWISVKERLPAELVEVLAFTEANEQGVFMAFMENGEWLDGCSGRGLVIIQQGLVTHWMPLPGPPEEDDNG